MIGLRSLVWFGGMFCDRNGLLSLLERTAECCRSWLYCMFRNCLTETLSRPPPASFGLQNKNPGEEFNAPQARTHDLLFAERPRYQLSYHIT